MSGRGRRGLWRHHDFLKLWAAESISQLGSQITLLAMPLAAALTLRASAAQMGILSAAGTAPFLLLGLVVGAWVDRLRRRPLLIAADLGRAALLATVPLAWALGALRIEVLYVVAFLTGTLTVVFDVAYLAFLPTLIDREELPEGNSRLQASASAAQVVGPGMAGALVGLISAPLALLVDAASFLASAGLIAGIRTEEPAPAPPAARRPVRREIAEGLQAVLGNPVLRAMAGASATTSLFGYVFLAVYVLYLTDDLGLGPTAVGLVFGCGGFGALLGALLAAPAARRFGLGPTIIGARFLFGLGGLTIVLAVSVRPLALPMVLASEFSQWLTLVVADVNQLSLRQAITPDRLQGRVNATVRFLVSGAIPLGSLLGGAIGQALGVRAALLVGVLGMLIAFVWVLRSPLRRLRERPVVPEAAVEERVAAR